MDKVRRTLLAAGALAIGEAAFVSDATAQFFQGIVVRIVFGIVRSVVAESVGPEVLEAVGLGRAGYAAAVSVRRSTKALAVARLSLRKSVAIRTRVSAAAECGFALTDLNANVRELLMRVRDFKGVSVASGQDCFEIEIQGKNTSEVPLDGFFSVLFLDDRAAVGAPGALGRIYFGRLSVPPGGSVVLTHEIDRSGMSDPMSIVPMLTTQAGEVVAAISFFPPIHRVNLEG